MIRTITASPQAIADELAPLFAAEKAAFARRCRERQISMAHLFVMVMIEREGPIAMTRVAELIGSGLPTATGLVGRMEDRGLVQRAHDQRDRRVVLVQLTNSGAAELSSLHAARRSRIAAVVADLSESDRVQLLSAIRTLRAAYARADRDGVPA